MNKCRVAAYCRVSSELEMQADSLAAQREWFEFKYSNTPDVDFVGVYVDDRSGTSVAQRPGFCEMLANCRSGGIDMIVTKSISRFSRNMEDFLKVICELRQLGIAVLFENEAINTMDACTEMLLSILAAICQEEVNAISNGLKWAIRRRDASGKPNYRVSYGYRRNRHSGEWMFHPREAERVRTAFRLAADGYTYAELESELRRLETSAPTGANWNQRRLHYVFTNIHYIGDVLTQKTYISDYLNHKRMRNTGKLDQYYLQDHHPAIVDRELFHLVNARIDAGLLRSGRRRSI